MTAPLEPARRSAPGQVPPHNLEAEESLLGAMLLSRDAIGEAIDRKLTAADFYKPAHGNVFDAMLKLYGLGEPVDPVTMADELRRAELLDAMGGRQTLLKLQHGTPASANAVHYAKIVWEHALLRRLIAAAGSIAELGYDDSVEDVRDSLDRAEALLFDVSDREQSSPMVTFAEAIQGELDEQEALYGVGRDMVGVPTGYRDLDRNLHGLAPGQMIVVAARPSMGKTAFALGAAIQSAHESARPTLFFSLEMSVEELRKRAIAQIAGVDLEKFKTATLDEHDWEKVTAATAKFAGAPLIFGENPHITVMDIRAQARRVKSKYRDLGLIVVDYIQLMTPLKSARADNRQVEVAELSRGLKVLARELECPVMALSQLNRQLEYRVDKRPMLADLRDSGALEQDSDVVIFLFREEVYDDQTENRGVAEVNVAKHRNGPTGVTRLAFLPKSTRFADMARL